MKLRDIAHSRAGDKGDISNLSVIVYDLKHYAFLERSLTADRVRLFLKDVVKGEVTRYALPALGAFNFVMQHSLGGGVTKSLALDAHGKCLSSAILEMEIPEDWT